jgi:hypothetical protein
VEEVRGTSEGGQQTVSGEGMAMKEKEGDDGRLTAPEVQNPAWVSLVSAPSLTGPRVSPKKPDELLSLLKGNNVNELKEALSLLYSWGIREVDYLPVLGLLLSHDDPEVLRYTLGMMRHHEELPHKEFLQLKQHLPTLRKFASIGKEQDPSLSEWSVVRFSALELIVALCGPSQDLVPHLRDYLVRWPEEACDLIYKFGPIAKDLVPDLIRMLQAEEDSDTTWAMVDAVGAIGPAAQEAVPILEKLTKHRSGVITGRACIALENITGTSRYAWPRGPDAV